MAQATAPDMHEVLAAALVDLEHNPNDANALRIVDAVYGQINKPAPQFGMPLLPRHGDFPTDGARNERYPQQAPQMRSANTPLGDSASEYLGNFGGHVVSGFDRAMQGAVRDVKGMAGTLAEFTGVPSMIRGAQSAGEGVAEGRPIKAVGGMAQAALSALPYSGAVGRAALATAPRAMATAGAMGLAPVAASGLFSEANADGADRLQQLYQRQQAMQDAMKRAMREREAQRPKNRAPSVKSDPRFTLADQEVTDLQSAMSALDKEISILNERSSPEYLRNQEAERRKQEAGMPFRERYPEIAGALPAAGLALSAGLPFGLKAVSKGMSWAPFVGTPSRVNTATKELENAAASGNATLAAQKNREIETLLRSESPMNQAVSAGTAAAAGGALTAEANLFPDQYDAFNLPAGPAQQSARAHAMDPMAYLERGAVGTLTGLSGYKAAGLIPERPINVGRARGAQAIAAPDFANDVLTIRQNIEAAKRKLPPAPPMPSGGQPAPPAAPAPVVATQPSNLGTGPAGPVGGLGPTVPATPSPNAGAAPNIPVRRKGANSPSVKPSEVIGSVRDRFISNDGKLTTKDWQELAPDLTQKQRDNMLKKLTSQLSDAGDIGVMRRMKDHLKVGAGVAGGTALAAGSDDD